MSSDEVIKYAIAQPSVTVKRGRSNRMTTAWSKICSPVKHRSIKIDRTNSQAEKYTPNEKISSLNKWCQHTESVIGCILFWPEWCVKSKKEETQNGKILIAFVLCPLKSTRS